MNKIKNKIFISWSSSKLNQHKLNLRLMKINIIITLTVIMIIII